MPAAPAAAHAAIREIARGEDEQSGRRVTIGRIAAPDRVLVGREDALGVEPSGCLPSDHAGIVATVTLPRSAAQDAALVDAGSPSLSPLAVPGILAIVVVVGLAVPTLAIAGIVALGSRGRGRRRGDGSGAA